MQSMQEIVETTTQYLHNLSLRERVLVLVVACGIILFIGDALLLSRYDDDVKGMKNQHHNLVTERQGLEAQIADVTAQLAEAKATHQQAKDAVTETEIALKQKTAQIEDKLNRLVPPTQITELLRNLLANTEGLKVLSVNNEPVRDISIDVDPDAAENSEESKTLLYEHAATIKLSGSYQLLYDYLIELENTGWELFWDTLHYRVTSYPNAEITLRVLTVSTDKHWIGL
jgi:MSHA biogenesis protein MshJ